jgi:hypothetical protein
MVIIQEALQEFLGLVRKNVTMARGVTGKIQPISKSLITDTVS